MEFILNPEQEALATSFRRQLGTLWPAERVRAAESTLRLDGRAWLELAATGCFGTWLPEIEGGSGLGRAEAVLVYEALGAALVPGPLVGAAIGAGQIPGALDGTALVGFVDAAEPIVVVEHLADLDCCLLVSDDAVSVVDADHLRARASARNPLDPLTPVSAVSSLDDLPATAVLGGAETARQYRRDGALLCSALLLGIAGAVTDLAVAYAKQREQFGRPIGAFQAIKHLLADMFVRAEMARTAVYAAAVTVDLPAVGDADRAVRGAKILAGEAALLNAKTALQVHGGMGFTWELDVHRFLKRAWVLETAYGSGEEHAAWLAEALGSDQPDAAALS